MFFYKKSVFLVPQLFFQLFFYKKSIFIISKTIFLAIFKKRLILTVFITELEVVDEEQKYSNNIITLNGFVCKKPVYRQTPFGREIADVLLAVNRAYNKSDYIPSIAWGRNARFCQNMEVGTEVKIVGRV